MTPDPITPSPDSPTPRTDERTHIYVLHDGVIWKDMMGDESVDAEFARQLERELASLQDDYKAVSGAYEIARKFMQDVNENGLHAALKAEIAALQSAREKEREELQASDEQQTRLAASISDLRATLAERDREIEAAKRLSFTHSETLNYIRAAIHGYVDNFEEAFTLQEIERLKSEARKHDELEQKEMDSLRAQLAERDREIFGLKEQLRIDSEGHTKSADVLRSQLQAATARAEDAKAAWLDAEQEAGDLEGDNTELTSQLLALQAHVEAQSRVLRNLIFTATKCWDDVKPIKDGPGLRVTHPMIEEAKAVMESQPDLTLIEEVREVLNGLRETAIQRGTISISVVDKLLTRLNPLND